MQSVQIVRRGALWIAHLMTRYGHIELLCGEANEPNSNVLLLVKQFLNDGTDHIAAVRRSAFGMPRLWRPIRVAVNNQGRLGLQFRHRLTGKHEGMFFADEHSTFQTRLADVVSQQGERGPREGFTPIG
jgi:hypothetical protein